MSELITNKSSFWAYFRTFLGILSQEDSSPLKTRDVYGKNANRGNSTRKEWKRSEKWLERVLIAFKVHFRVTVHQNKRNLGDFPHFSVFWWRPPRIVDSLTPHKKRNGFSRKKEKESRARAALKSTKWWVKSSPARRRGRRKRRRTRLLQRLRQIWSV